MYLLKNCTSKLIEVQLTSLTDKFTILNIKILRLFIQPVYMYDYYISKTYIKE